MDGSNDIADAAAVTNIGMTHETADPRPPGENATDDDWDEYRTKLSEYVKGWCKMQTGTIPTPAHALWCDFTCDFGVHGILHLDASSAKDLRNLLISHGIFVQSRRGLQRAQALLECWKQEKCPMVGELDKRADSPEGNETLEPASNDTGNVGTVRPVVHTALVNNARVNEDNGQGANASAVATNSGNSLPRNDSGDSSCSSGSLQGLMKAFAGRRKYSGAWDEDLQGIIEVFEMSAQMCDLNAQQMLKGVPIMLDGPALAYFASNLKSAPSYDDAIQGLMSWYTSEEQRTRLLREWQDARLSTWMRRSPDKSELAVFRDLSATLARIQRQLHVDYRKDRFLKDQLVAAADIEHVSRALKEKAPLTAHEASQRIASLLSGEPKSAGARANTDESAYYGLGQRYRGDAERRVGPVRGNFSRNANRRKLAKIKGCWVCGKQHLAHRFHSKEEVKKGLEKHKKAGAYVAVEDVISVFLAESEEDAESSELESEDMDDQVMIAEEIRDINKELETNLSNKVFLHTCGFLSRRKKEINDMEQALLVDERQSEFNGVLVDTGANRTSLMSLTQYRAYCTEHGVPANLTKSTKRVCGIGGSQRSIGKARIPIPFPNLGLISDIDFHIIEDEVPTLLSLRDLKSTGIDMSIQQNCLMFMGKKQRLVHENDFLYYRWSPDVALFSHAELLKLHRSFGHPSVSALHRVLKRARPEEMSRDVREAIEKLTENCNTCAELAQKPKRFKLTVGAEESVFNSTVATDIMYISRRPVLHVVDEATHFAAAIFLRKVSSKEVWKAFLRCWTHVYLGPPDYLKIDQGSNFTSKEFKGLAEATGIQILECPIESPATMSHVERYHAPLRAAYEKLEHDLNGESKECLLQMALHCVNNTVGPEGFCPTMCVFGAMPKPARNTPAPEQIARAKAIDDAMKVVEREQCKRKVQFGLKYRGPYGKEQTELDKLHYGAPVRVYREKAKMWDGPFKFVSKEGETVCVQLPRGRRIFRSHVVKPVKYDVNDETSTATASSNQSSSTDCTKAAEETPSDTALYALFGDEYHVYATASTTHSFQDSRRAELAGLKKAKVFKVVDRCTVPKGTRIYGTRWVDTLKPQDDGSQKEKSRLVAQNFRDYQARSIPTKAPTISKLGQRLSLAIAAMHPNGNAYVRDITQAYIQSKSELERDVYLKPPPEMNLSEDKVLIAVKPLYGVPESGLHWFLTYKDHHVKKLGMQQCTIDKCLLYKRSADYQNSRGVPDITILQVDDSFGIGSNDFLEIEDIESREFATKPRKTFGCGDTHLFNGSEIKREAENVYSISNKSKLEVLEIPKTERESVSARAKLQYVATVSRPDLASPVQLLASKVKHPSEETTKNLGKIIEYSKEKCQKGLRFVNLDKDTMRIVLFTDASFGNTQDLSSQIGFVVTLVDGDNNANIIHYGSKKCRRVTRSVMAAEILALVIGFDQAYIVKHALGELLDIDIPIDAFIDSRTTFNCVAKNASTIEKRLQIDVAALRESYTRGELRCLGWIPGHMNPADGLTKSIVPGNTHALNVLMNSNKLDLQPQGWAEPISS